VPLSASLKIEIILKFIAGDGKKKKCVAKLASSDKVADARAWRKDQLAN